MDFSVRYWFSVCTQGVCYILPQLLCRFVYVDRIEGGVHLGNDPFIGDGIQVGKTRESWWFFGYLSFLLWGCEILGYFSSWRRESGELVLVAGRALGWIGVINDVIGWRVIGGWFL
jgi:hypothetical protein